MTSLKCYFLKKKKNQTEFDKIFWQDVKMMSDKVLKFGVDILRDFQVIAIIERGRIMPPVGRGLT